MTPKNEFSGSGLDESVEHMPESVEHTHESVERMPESVERMPESVERMPELCCARHHAEFVQPQNGSDSKTENRHILDGAWADVFFSAEQRRRRTPVGYGGSEGGIGKVPTP